MALSASGCERIIAAVWPAMTFSLAQWGLWSIKGCSFALKR